MDIAEKLTAIAENEKKVYDAGKNEIISLHPEKTVSGSYISVDDVSELPHDVKCKVESVNLIDVNKLNIGYEIGLEAQTDAQPNANWFTTDLAEVLPNTTYTLSGVSSKTRVEYDKNGVAVSWIKGVNAEWTFTTGENTHYVRFNSNISGYSEPMLNRGATKLPYTPYVNPESVTVTRCGTNLLNPDNLQNGEFVEYNGIPCYKYRDNANYFKYTDNFTENTQYTLSVKLYAEDEDTSVSAFVRIWYTDGTKEHVLVFHDKEYVITSAPNKTIEYISGSYNLNRVLYIDLSYTRLSFGATPLPYEPYNGQILTPAADGTIEGLTSTYPQMNIFTDNADAMLDVIYRISAGKKAEYDAFWDVYQENGQRTSYLGAFAGTGWTKDTFKPKYPIAPTQTSGAWYMFFGFNALPDTEVIDFRDFAHLFDFSRVPRANSMFADAKMDYIDVDLSNATTLQSAFAQSTFMQAALTTLSLKVSEKATTYNNAFDSRLQLRNLTFKEGSVIAAKINLQWSPLTKESITSVINALSPTVTGQTCTFKKSAKEEAFTADEWATLIATKTNWTFSLV